VLDQSFTRILVKERLKIYRKVTLSLVTPSPLKSIAGFATAGGGVTCVFEMTVLRKILGLSRNNKRLTVWQHYEAIGSWRRYCQSYSEQSQQTTFAFDHNFMLLTWTTNAAHMLSCVDISTQDNVWAAFVVHVSNMKLWSKSKVLCWLCS